MEKLKYKALPHGTLNKALTLCREGADIEAVALIEPYIAHKADLLAQQTDHPDLYLNDLKETGRFHALAAFKSFSSSQNKPLALYMHDLIKGPMQLRLTFLTGGRTAYGTFPQAFQLFKDGFHDEALNLIEPFIEKKANLFAQQTVDPDFYRHDFQSIGRITAFKTLHSLTKKNMIAAASAILQTRIMENMKKFLMASCLFEKARPEILSDFSSANPEQNFAVQEDRKTLFKSLPKILAHDKEKGVRNMQILFLRACCDITLEQAAQHFGITRQCVNMVAGSEISDKRKKEIAQLPLNNPPSYP